MNYSVTRKAILIGCAGSDNNFLHGVEEDLTNMKNFLLSDKGGRWFPDKIAHELIAFANSGVIGNPITTQTLNRQSIAK